MDLLLIKSWTLITVAAIAMSFYGDVGSTPLADALQNKLFCDNMIILNIINRDKRIYYYFHPQISII